jgi:hypothetical protein
MPEEIYVANIVPTLSDDDIRELFADIGAVEAAENLINQRTQLPKNAMRVVLDTDKSIAEISDHLTGVLVEGQPIYISNVKPAEELLPPDEAQALAQDVANQLNESENMPVSQIHRMVRFAGRAFVESLLAETLQIEAEGGMMTSDDSRRRTVGGIFFYLARQRLSYKMQRAIYYVKQTQNDDSDDKPRKKPLDGANHAPAAAPITDQETLDEARRELEQLRNEYDAAQKYLEVLKSQPAEDRKSGLFSATRDVVNLQKQINAVLRDFPQLED